MHRLWGLGLAGLGLWGVGTHPFEDQPDPVARLQANLASGKSKLEFDAKHGYLASVLKAFSISPSSQVLVFSKTSFQGSHISPKTPRALYFNDHTYIGWVQGGDYIEIVSVDPDDGPKFYTLPNQRDEKAPFTLEGVRCIACHGGGGPNNLPNLMVRSVFPDQDGSPVFTSGGRNVSPSTPFRERWGGWYVSGTHGKQRHMGNVIATGEDVEHAIDPEKGANLTDLSRLFDVKPYLAPTSDIVALMVLEHQLQIQNILGRFAIYARNVVSDSSESAEGKTQRLANRCAPLVNALMCSGEVELSDPVKGKGRFERDYLAGLPKDASGRSLGDFDLKSRLFRYRCSPMIYSEAFDRLPEEAKRQLYARLRDTLKASQLTDGEATWQILMDTKPEIKQLIGSLPN